MTRWEYKLDEVTAGQIKSSAEDVMNGWGRGGWELVSFTPVVCEADTYICVFKRPLEE